MKKILFAAVALSMSSTAFSNGLTPICQDYYAAIDSFVKKLESHEATKGEAEEIMAVYHEAKQHYASLPNAEQDRLCAREAEELREYRKMQQSK
ncbi:DUF5339 family protein [Paenalcaligenes sp. Me131]|uniref:DUF5339 family protein n=1 Tax=Paenalcaligenes sp. Me131 TaxID=3392636 RepID=UPI003D2C2E1E